jgi:hypothetical protein
MDALQVHNFTIVQRTCSTLGFKLVIFLVDRKLFCFV